MTEVQFSSRAFKNAMPLMYKHKRSGEYWDCLLCAIDFDNEVIKLYPIPDAEFELGDGKEFWTSYENVEFQPKNYLKMLKS